HHENHRSRSADHTTEPPGNDGGPEQRDHPAHPHERQPVRRSRRTLHTSGLRRPRERDIVFLETAVDDRMLEEKDVLRRYMLRFEQLRAVALSAEASRDRLLKGTGYAERLGKQPSGIRVATPNPPVLIASRSAGWPGTT